MSYNHNEYNYQIAVVFGILVGGCLLLALVVAGIYFMCVNTMRDDDKKRLNSGSGRNSATNWSNPPRDQPSASIPYNPAPQQNYDFGGSQPPRTPVNVTSYTPVPSATPYQQYSNMPLATPINQQYITHQTIPQYQPEVIYTQGPATYVQQQPVEYTVNTPANYVQSSV